MEITSKQIHPYMIIHGECLQAMKSNKKWIGIEKERRYCEIGQKRINEIRRYLNKGVVEIWEIN